MSAAPHSALLVDKNRLAVEHLPAEPDNEKVTAQTIALMCRCIRESCNDSLVRSCAQNARVRFGANMPAALADVWGVFWFVKHAIRFRSDEGALLEFMGERDQQDLLISPAVLLRMTDPKEDCDGFSMLTAALLAILNIPVYLVTVAVDPREPARWSHVFCMAELPGGALIPLDTSHGSEPGWMVPWSDVKRIQGWTLAGEKAKLDFSRIPRRGLNGYLRAGRGFRGLGDCTPIVDPDTGDTIDTVCSDNNPVGPGAAPGVPTPFPPSSGAGGSAGGSMGASSGNFFQDLLAAISGAGAAARTIASTAAAPPGYVYNPQTGTYVRPGAPGATFGIGPGGITGAGSFPWLPLLLVGGLVVVMGARK